MRITNKIHFRNLRGDIFGGVTAAIIALPMALAFGVASGAGATAGLYGAILVGFFAALFGGTPTLISEPTGPMTVVMTAVIANLTANNPGADGMAMAFTVVMLGGLFQIALGALRLGQYITLMPYTVVSGFMSGIGFILIVLQLPPFLGHDSSGGVIGTLQQMPEFFSNVNLGETGLALFTIAILFFMPSRLSRIIPPQLTALILGTIISVVAFSDPEGIRRIGEIPAGLPQLQMPMFDLSQIRMMVVDAAVLGMLGAIDALLTSTVADSLTRSQHDSNKELIGQGLGNVASGLFGGLPGAGATMGTVVNIQTGARTALSGLTRAGVLIVVVFGARGLVEDIPMAVLAGIALKVGIDIIDWSFLKRAHQVSWKGALIVYGVILLTVFVDLITAVGVGVFVANVLTIDRLTKLQSKDVRAITDADDEINLDKEEKQLLNCARGDVLLFHLSGPMIFGVSKAISRQHNAIDRYKVLIFDLSDVPLLGVTSSLAIENAIQEAVENDREVFIVGAAGNIKRRLEDFGILNMLPPDHLLMDRRQALREAMKLIGKSQEVFPQDAAVITAVEGNNRSVGSE
ncbi:SulP family inorganic anion transporter [Geitlerinema sp. PCC 9228]|jgi:SulP family sulfate permease|uniref:bicarbonate transporter BicA n=1 Tax=Geitlerinema sp. PCC 9228 TaxID=111611 RepID=UPI0008F9C4FE|nr:SulP family inorganic anion transporter [Geitlerinema sp. PCC 9228]